MLALNMPINLAVFRWDEEHGDRARWRQLRRWWDLIHTARVLLDSSGSALVAIAAVWHLNVNERETVGHATLSKSNPTGCSRRDDSLQPESFGRSGGGFPRVCSHVTSRRIASDLADPRLLLRVHDPPTVRG
jgi:hypothetical protein